MRVSLHLILLASATSAFSPSQLLSRVGRKTGFNDIISNYFNSNNKAATKKPRIHLPQRGPTDQQPAPSGV